MTVPTNEARILIVDDDEASIDSLRRTLHRAGYKNLQWTTDPREVLQLCLWNEPDLLLLDLHMPLMSGEEVLVRLREDLTTTGYLPVIMLTGDVTLDAKQRAFHAGARDFVAKPYDRDEVLLRIQSHLEVRRKQDELNDHNRVLQKDVQDRAEQLRDAQIELLHRLARAAEYRDDDTGEHATRVGDLSARIAGELGLPSELVELIWRAATLHDIGKIGISDTILQKPGKLTDTEMEIMRRHISIGAEILGGGSNAYLAVAERVALTHHEWWDGNGYQGLSGEEIPIEGRIVAIADVFDALTHARSYKAAWSVEKAIDHIVNLRGRHFDPAVVDAFLRVMAADGLTVPTTEPASKADTAATPPLDDETEASRPSLLIG